MHELKQGYLGIKKHKRFDEIKISNILKKEVKNDDNEVNINDNQYNLYIFRKRTSYSV